MQVCEQCGTCHDDSAVFCRSCEYPLDTREQTEAMRQAALEIADLDNS